MLSNATNLKISKEMLKLLAAEYESRKSDTSTPTASSASPPTVPEPIKINVTRLNTARMEPTIKKSSTTSLSGRYHAEMQKRRGSVIGKKDSAHLNTSLNSISVRGSGDSKSHPNQIKKSYIAQAVGDIGSPLVAAVTPKMISESELDHTSWDLFEPRCQKPLVPKKLHMGLCEKRESEAAKGKLSGTNSMAILKTVKMVLQQRVGNNNKDLETNGKKMGPHYQQQISPI